MSDNRSLPALNSLQAIAWITAHAGQLTPCHRPPAIIGEKNANAKLTEPQVVDIRRIYATGGTSHRKLAKRFGVAQATVAKIVNGIAWTHV